MSLCMRGSNATDHAAHDHSVTAYSHAANSQVIHQFHQARHDLFVLMDELHYVATDHIPEAESLFGPTAT